MTAARDRLHELAAIESSLWAEMIAAVADKSHPWRVAVLATTDGVSAQARSVVLRDIDAESRTLLAYTDARSPKSRQLADHPLGTLVLWSPALGWQLRLTVSMTLQTEGLQVASRWARLETTSAAQDYRSPLPPGSPLGMPQQRPQRDTADHFAVISAEVTAIDWLELHPDGHRRAAFDGDGARWLVP